jgi:hypothetical protein
MVAMLLFHASRICGPLAEFLPFSHSGTAKAALRRARGQTVASFHGAWLHEADLDARMSAMSGCRRLAPARSVMPPPAIGRSLAS